MKIIKILSIIFLLFSLNACHDDFEDESKTETPVPNPVIIKAITGDVIGYVYDESNQAVPNAKIKIYNSTVTTNEYGIFSFNNITLDRQGTYLRVEKPGYIFGSDFLYPDNGTSYSYIQILSITNDKSFNATEGGIIDIKGGGKVIFSPNSIASDDGSSYSGTVLVTANRLATDDPQIGNKMPGSLRAEDHKTNSVVLGTYGMAVIELRDASGNELNLKSGFTANISFPLSNDLKDKAPNTIPLWYFDELKGFWIEEGQATLVNGAYEGDVAHFSWWNCDAPFPIIQLCVRVLFQSGLPAVNYLVGIKAENTFTRYASTDGNGIICGKIPKGEKLTLEIKNPFCDEIIKTISVGPYSNDVILDDIIIEAPINLGSGNVICSGAPVSTAHVILNYTTATVGGSIIIPVEADGSFVLGFSPQVCEDISSMSIFGYNYDSGEASSTITLDPNTTTPNIELELCNNCDFSVEISPSYPELCDLNPSSTIEATTSQSGTYTYSWSYNSEPINTTSSISNLETGTYCVTVTNTSGNCEKIACIEISSPLQLNIKSAKSPYCGYDNGEIRINRIGGFPPYTYNTTGPNGYNSDTETLDNLAPGTYQIEVTDAHGCHNSTTAVLSENQDYFVDIFEEGESDCIGTYLFANVNGVVGSPNLTYTWSNGEASDNIAVTESGEYCVTITDENACAIEGCVIVELLPYEELIIKNCNKSLYTYELYFNQVDIIPQTGDPFNVTWNQNVVIDVLKHQYMFTAQSPFNQSCLSENFLPIYNDTLDVSANHTSCIGCTDGSLTINITTGQSCSNCSFENMTIAVYLEDDLNEDLSLSNTNGTLIAGNYIVALLDDNTGCFIGHKTIILD